MSADLSGCKNILEGAQGTEVKSGNSELKREFDSRLMMKSLKMKVRAGDQGSPWAVKPHSDETAPERDVRDQVS